MASAIKWALVCQYACLPSLSSHLKSLNEASSVIGRSSSIILSFTLQANTSCASLWLMLSAISYPVTPSLYSRTDPSGKDIFIIIILLSIFKPQNYQKLFIIEIFTPINLRTQIQIASAKLSQKFEEPIY